MEVFGLVLITIILALYLIKAARSGSRVGIYLCGVYLFSCIIAYLIVLDKSNRIEYSLFSSIAFIGTLSFYLIPFLSRFPQIDDKLSPRSIRRFVFIGYSVSIVLLIGDILITSKLQEVAAVGFAEARVMGYNDDPTLTSFTFTQHIGHSILRWFSGLSYLLIIMFFYAMAFVPKKTFLKFLLAISSLSAGYFGLCSAGRTRLMYWFLFFIMAYMLFGRYLSKKSKKIIRLSIVVFASIVVAFFVLITLLRSELQGIETNDFLTAYAGQPIVNFCTYIEDLEPPSFTMYRVLPLSSTIVSGRFDLLNYQSFVYSRTGFEINGFNTMIGDFYIDTGFIGMVLISVVFCFITINLLKRRRLRFYHLGLLTILLQIPLFGIFYYSLWQMESSVCSIMTILFGIFITIPNNKTKQVYNG